MGIAIAIVAVIALAVIGLVVTARSRATTGRLSRETRKRDEAAGASTVADGGRARRRDDRRWPRRPTRAGRAPTRPASAIESGSSQVPEPRAGGTAVVYEPVDLDELGVTRRQFFNRSILAGSGLGLGAFGVAALAFLWPSARAAASAARSSSGSEADAKDRLRQQDPVLQRDRQDLHRRLPEGRPPQGEEGDGVHPADHRRDGAGLRRALPEVRAPRLPGAVVPELAVVRVPVPRLEVQPGR